MKKKPTATKDEEIRAAIAFCQRMTKHIPEPNAPLVIGTKVRIGCLPIAPIIGISEDGKIAAVQLPDKVGGWAWYDINPAESKAPFGSITGIDDIFSRTRMTSIQSVLGQALHWGIDFDVDYQRELMWTQKQKDDLLQSILRGVPIGTVCLNQRKYLDGQKAFEVIDGKQRISTLLEFKLGKFKLNGYLYREFCQADQSAFENYPLASIMLENATREQILTAFIKLNRGGVPVSESHLQKVEQLLKKS